MPFGGVRKLPDNHLLNGLMTSVSRRRPLSHCLTTGACDVCRRPIYSPVTVKLLKICRLAY